MTAREFSLTSSTAAFQGIRDESGNSAEDEAVGVEGTRALLKGMGRPDHGGEQR